MYADNCIPIDGSCPRKIFISGVDPVWSKNAKERQEALEKKIEVAKRKQVRISQEKAALEKSKMKENSPVEDIPDDGDERLERQDSNENFKAPARAEPSKVMGKLTPTLSTRSSSNEDKDDISNNNNIMKYFLRGKSDHLIKR